jgi:hypothetical protein
MGLINTLNDPFDKRWKDNAKEIIDDFLEEFDDADLKDVISELEKLKKTGIYERLFSSFKLGKRIIASGVKLNIEEYQSRRFAGIAYNNLSFPPINLSPFTNLIHAWHINAMYGFIEYLYYANTERPINYEDAKNLYLSRLDEHIIFGLDKFDENLDIPEVTSDYFNKLQKVKWQDKIIKKLFFRLNVIRKIIECGSASPFCPMQLKGIESQFILLLAGCSVVNDERDKILKEDLIKAYKTYFKLLRTDITKYKAQQNLLSSKGYLVCDKCNEYYKLQPGESPEDFTDKCECGGNLRFMKDLNEIEIDN